MRCGSGGPGPPENTSENGVRSPTGASSVTSISSTSNAVAPSGAIRNRSPRSAVKSAAVSVSSGGTPPSVVHSGGPNVNGGGGKRGEHKRGLTPFKRGEHKRGLTPF